MKSCKLSILMVVWKTPLSYWCVCLGERALFFRLAAEIVTVIVSFSVDEIQGTL